MLYINETEATIDDVRLMYTLATQLKIKIISAKIDKNGDFNFTTN